MNRPRFATKRVPASGRSRVTSLLLALLTAGSLLACRKAPRVNRAQVVSPAELQRTAAAAEQSLEGLRPLVGSLNTKFAELHQKYDKLPPALPGFSEARGKFYATAEGLGTMNAKLVWLSGRIDAAVKAGDGAELKEASRDIARTYDEVRQVERIALELDQEMPPFLQKAEERQANGQSSCERDKP